jgi:general stress protein 26
MTKQAAGGGAEDDDRRKDGSRGSSNDHSPRNSLWRHIRNIRFCMMATHDGDRVVARPMAGIPRPEQNVIWFFTSTETHKDAEIEQDPRACLTYADIQDQTYVSVSGRIERVTDHDTIHDLWTEGAGLYFPLGPDDPEIVLLRFSPESGEYWDSPSSKIVLAIKFLEAKMTGERPVLGSHGTTTLSAPPAT